MLTGLIIVVHVIVCILLATLILVQSGKGGGLTEQFAPAGEMFGTQTSGFLVKGTSIFAVLFLVTCLGLAVLSARKDESLMSKKIAPLTATTTNDSTAADPEVEMAVTDVEQAAQQMGAEVNEATQEVAPEVEEVLPVPAAQ